VQWQFIGRVLHKQQQANGDVSIILLLADGTPKQVIANAAISSQMLVGERWGIDLRAADNRVVAAGYEPEEVR
jgi:hypothetical protein